MLSIALIIAGVVLPFGAMLWQEFERRRLIREWARVADLRITWIVPARGREHPDHLKFTLKQRTAYRVTMVGADGAERSGVAIVPAGYFSPTVQDVQVEWDGEDGPVVRAFPVIPLQTTQAPSSADEGERA